MVFGRSAIIAQLTQAKWMHNLTFTSLNSFGSLCRWWLWLILELPLFSRNTELEIHIFFIFYSKSNGFFRCRAILSSCATMMTGNTERWKYLLTFRPQLDVIPIAVRLHHGEQAFKKMSHESLNSKKEYSSAIVKSQCPETTFWCTSYVLFAQFNHMALHASFFI